MSQPRRYLALNDFVDALQAFPQDIVRQFTLLKEIDAKCVSNQPELNHHISKFMKENNKENSSVNEKVSDLTVVKDILLSNLPCYEEKMTIANLSTDLVAKHLDRINHALEAVINHEIPKIVKYGPKNHPAVISDAKLPENKSAQSQRSESRREAIAARKAATTTGSNNNANSNSPTVSTNSTNGGANNNTGRPGPRREGTPAGRKRKPQAPAKSVGVAQTRTEEPAPKRQKPSSKRTSNAISATVTVAPVHASPSPVPHKEEEEEGVNDVYCVCQQVSFGEMIGCDNDKCKIQWFHLQCVGLSSPPKGTWYCDDCKKQYGMK
ncbi:Pho23 protein [Saccharomycopsis crataegensis]|uniref:Chromatin modification-related protein n=1 Tax=Saccharomycopsis crataegensis TaxID=43959 RepID=A0AAV5QW95_9ASCO|nr:Pho23 protein [Saccharomycopsis crataegensis]